MHQTTGWTKHDAYFIIYLIGKTNEKDVTFCVKFYLYVVERKWMYVMLVVRNNGFECLNLILKPKIFSAIEKTE